MRHDDPIHPFSPDPDRDFEIRTVLGHAGEGASDPGEVLAATASLKKDDHEGWFAAWNGLGDRAAARAGTASSAGHRVSAAEANLRASAYFGVAVNAVSGLSDTSRLRATFAKQRAAWERFVDEAPVLVDRVDIPYTTAANEADALPGWFFRPAPGTATGAALVAVNGSDGSLAALWASSVSAALKRGYAVLVFDGPGQQSQLFEKGVPFRPDWENVLTPAFDVVAVQEGVDAGRIAVYGISQAGYWVPRALAFEHRFAAAVVDPGVVDVSTSWTSHLPKSLRKLVAEAGTGGADGAAASEKLDREMALGLKLSPGTARTWSFRARPYGSTGYAQTLVAVSRYTVADVAGRITTPLFITDPEGEQFWPGQAEQLAALTPGVSTLVRFTAAEGASGHCEPLARGLVVQRMYDWLDERLARSA
jgi:hypothetical protein